MSRSWAVTVGMTSRQEEIVTKELTVGGHVDGMPFVYCTPIMIMLMEKASGLSVAGHLPPGWVTVGSEVSIRHLAPTPIGRTVTATSTVLDVEGRSVLFAVEAHDGEARLARARTAAAPSTGRASPSATVSDPSARAVVTDRCRAE